MSRKLTVGVIGASGHAGGELCRLLLQHDGVGAILPTSRSATPFERQHANLLGSGLEFVSQDDLAASARTLDVVFFCTPSGEAMQMAGTFLEAGCRVIDLSPDFRFPTAQAYEHAYGRAHTAPQLLPLAAYGATEIYREHIRRAQLVANPGCYALACLLGLVPLVRAGLLDPGAQLHVSAVNGTTGASSTPMRETHHAHAANGMLAYSLEGHRHSAELEHYLGAEAGRPVTVVMSTAHGPFPRGIQAVITARPAGEAARGMTRGSLTAHYLRAYGEGTRGEFFVVVNPFERTGAKTEKEYHLYPNVARLAGSNFCHLGLDYDPDRGHLKVVSAIDNLVKGAAGSAIQNMNLMLGDDETRGLRAFGL